MKNIKAIVLTYPANLSTKVETIRKTWGRHVPINFLSDYPEAEDVFGYPYLKQGYENISLKICEYIKLNPSDNSTEWYLFADDDTFVNLKNIQSLLTFFDDRFPICIGTGLILRKDATDFFGKHTGFPLKSIKGENTKLPLVYLGGGAGFLMNRACYTKLNNYLSKTRFRRIPAAYSGDVAVGFWLRNIEVPIVDIVGFWSNTPEYYNHDKIQIAKSFSYHYISPELMVGLYRMCEAF